MTKNLQNVLIALGIVLLGGLVYWGIRQSREPQETAISENSIEDNDSIDLDAALEEDFREMDSAYVDDETTAGITNNGEQEVTPAEEEGLITNKGGGNYKELPSGRTNTSPTSTKKTTTAGSAKTTPAPSQSSSAAKSAPKAKTPSSKPKEELTAKGATSTGKFYVMAGSFLVETAAKNEAKRLQQLGFTQMKVDVIASNKKYYSVFAGPYDETTARNLKTKLEQGGQQAFVKPAQ